MLKTNLKVLKKPENDFQGAMRPPPPPYKAEDSCRELRSRVVGMGCMHLIPLYSNIVYKEEFNTYTPFSLCRCQKTDQGVLNSKLNSIHPPKIALHTRHSPCVDAKKSVPKPSRVYGIQN